VPTNGGYKSLWIIRNRKLWEGRVNRPRQLGDHYDKHHPTGTAPVKY
jgi:hypothetical protein